MPLNASSEAIAGAFAPVFRFQVEVGHGSLVAAELEVEAKSQNRVTNCRGSVPDQPCSPDRVVV